MDTAMDTVFLCRFDDLPDGESRGFDPWHAGQDSVLLVRRGARVFGWRDACPHHGGTPMAWRKDAYLNADRSRIVCAAHGAQFDIETGACTLGPCLGQGLQAVELVLTRTKDIYIRQQGGKETSHGSARS
jgi:nitrite reductase/ring-hydroxylating ferredoxin subunit